MGGYYFFLDLDLLLEMSVNRTSTDVYRHYSLEAAATRRIGRLTLRFDAGLHWAEDLAPDPSYGAGLP